ncbi:MAG: sulfatase-like hydrolase/transferase [Ferruginibacter sp.]|nr:sulfatase-like hydrolase/transferase [Ferruginibacter sp.]
MLIRWKFPKTIQWIIKLFIIYLSIFGAFRIATLLFFKPASITVASLFSSFWLGLQYDLRWIALILLPIACFSLFPRFSPFYSERCKKVWAIYLAIITLLLLFFFGADFGHFAYVNTRLNASALNFAEDAKTSFEMLWQSYPMVWILAGLLGTLVMMTWIFRKTHVSVEEQNINVHKFSYRRIWHTTTIVLLGWFVFGFLSFTPLRWSDAFKLNDNFKSYLALNPFQNFFTTLRFRNPVFSEDKAKTHYDAISDFLQLDKKNTRANIYERIVHPGSNALESKPNIVLIICESFSMYKSTMSGNPLNSTPFFNKLTKDGIFFDRCFSPTFGTARGVFAILTGIPDVQLSKFSTRNLQSLNQYTIINSFDGYSKMYFIGGSSDFNNFRGLINNINDVQIYEEGKFTSPRLNVWGISDKNLFLEADKVMKQQTKPFFTIIQTSDNHRPYSIPPDDKDFVPRTVNINELKKYGFESQEEFNAFCYTDFCYSRFMEAARRSPYFDNTIFVFVGDHGVEGNAGAVYPEAWTGQRLNDEHVPLLFYAPALLIPQKRQETVSQIDVLPTVANMVSQPYMNKTLGRNLLSKGGKEEAAFIIHHDEGKIGLVNNDYYFSKNLWIIKEELVPIRSGLPGLTASQTDSVKRKLSGLTSAIYETAKWMLVNNHGR